MAEQLNEDKLVVKKDNMVKKGAQDGWELIKITRTLRDELPVPQLRTVKADDGAYGVAFTKQ